MQNLDSHRLIRLILVLLLAGCRSEPAPPVDAVLDPVAEVDAIAEELWQKMLEEDLYLRVKYGLPVTELPDLTLEKARQDADFAARLLDRLAGVPKDRLPHESVLTVATLEHDLELHRAGPEHYWLPVPITAYGASAWLPFVHQALSAHAFAGPEAAEAYRQLLGKYRDMLDQMLAVLEGQVEREIRLPRPALPRAVARLEAYRSRAAAACAVQSERLAALDEAARTSFEGELPSAIADVEAAYDRLLAFLGDEYREAAPAEVGQAQYPGGDAYYRALVRRNTTLDVTPEEVHEIGLERMARIAARMRTARDEIGFAGTQQEFHQQLRGDPRFLARSPAEVEERLLSYVRRIEPLMEDFFFHQPAAPYGVRRLEPEEEGSRTFGTYRPPTAENPVGEYLYNGSHLEDRPLISAGSLIYHELLPGHHFQVALQNENETLPSLRREWFSTAFAEGWAEYAASLGWEMGLYEDPYDAYGRLLGEAFLTSRLVVDTGLNLLGWPLEKGREYMREHTFLSDLEIETETLRYSIWPGQALGYKMGHHKIDELRARAEEALGERFDVREFHAVVLGSGALPMTALEEHVEWYVEGQKRKGDLAVELTGSTRRGQGNESFPRV